VTAYSKFALKGTTTPATFVEADAVATIVAVFNGGTECETVYLNGLWTHKYAASNIAGTTYNVRRKGGWPSDFLLGVDTTSAGGGASLVGLQVTELSSIPITGEGEVRACNGFAANGDGGGGFFAGVLGTPPAEAEDGAFRIDAPGGQWQRVILDGVISAKAFGARGDGSTNDTAALRAAISYVQANNLKLRVPAGHYMVTNGGAGTVALSLTGNIEIEGDGVDKTIIDGGGSSTLTIFDVDTTGNKQASLRRLRIQSAGFGVRVHGSGLFLRYSCPEEIDFQNISQVGLWLDEIEATGITVHNLNFQLGTPAAGAKTYGIKATGSAVLHHTSFYNCRFAGHSGAGIDVQYSGLVAGPGSVGTILQQCFFEGAANSSFARTGTTNSSTSLTSVSSVSLLERGMIVAGTGIPVGAYITGISGSTVTISEAATASAAGVALTFYAGFGVKLNSASIVGNGCYFERNTAPDICVDADFAGGSLTVGRCKLYGPIFDFAGSSQFHEGEDGYRRVLVLNQGVEFKMVDAKISQQSGLDLLVDLSEKPNGKYRIIDSPGARFMNRLGCYDTQGSAAGKQAFGFIPNDNGTPVASGLRVGTSTYWGGVSMILAQGRTGSGPYGNRVGLYLLNWDSFDGSGSPSVAHVGGTDFMTFSFVANELYFAATDGNPSGISVLSSML
jgi:hypothetical protein